MKDLFLCHTGADKDWTRALAERLENEQIAGRPIEVFFDEWDIGYGRGIITEIDEGLKTSRYIGLVLSPGMLRAPWPTAEWQSQVMDDPVGRRARVLPLLLHKYDPTSGAPIELPFVLKGLKRFDFTDRKQFEVELLRLIRQLADLPPVRGRRRGGLGSALASPSTGQEAPDPVEEALPSNLFPVIRLPDALFSDVTVARKKADVWKTVTGAIPPFVLHGDRLFSFVPHDAPDNPFRPFLTGIDKMDTPTSEWLADIDLARQVIGMLNYGLREHCYHLGIMTPKSDRSHFYCPIFKEGEPRLFSWGKGRARTLATMKTRADGTAFGVHMSAHMRFIQLGAKLFMLAEPAWMFTTDGVVPLEGKEMGVFSTKWGGRERNAAVLRNVLMWGLLIGDGKPEVVLNVGTRKAPVLAVLRSVPSYTSLKAGLAHDLVRLDRILSGDGAGEMRAGLVATATIEGEEELEAVANLALLGANADEAPGETASVDDTVEEDDDAEAPF